MNNRDGETAALHHRLRQLEEENARLHRLVVRYEGASNSAKAAAAEAVRKYTSIVQNVVEGIYQSTPEGKVIDCSESMARMLGYANPNEIISGMHDLRRQFYVQPQMRDILIDLLGKTSVVRGFECEVFRKDGSRLWISINAHVVRSSSGEALYYEGTVEDISRRKKTEEDLRTLNRHLRRSMLELERSNNELQQFAYAASHDLQEPLRMVAGYVDLLARRCEEQLDPQTQDFARYAVDGARRMKMLIDDLLAFATVARGNLEFDAVDTNQAVSLAKENLALALRECGAQLQTAALPVAWGSLNQITLLFQNLLSNALKFRHPDRPAHIAVDCIRAPSEWVFSVSDNGIGFNMSYSERIFRIFQRLHTREQFPGTGIGLALCKKVVERLGGRIWAESREGEGSTFFFTLPHSREAVNSLP